LAYTAEEKETYFNYDDSSDVCYIYTCNKSLQRKLDSYCKKFPEEYKLVKQDNCSKSYTTKKKYISVKAPRAMTATRKAQLQLNAKKMLEARVSNT
jgi:hypothetical protein